jgi:hypothetical protein
MRLLVLKVIVFHLAAPSKILVPRHPYFPDLRVPAAERGREAEGTRGEAS